MCSASLAPAREKRSTSVCSVVELRGVVPKKNLTFFVNIMFVCLPFLYLPYFFASREHLTFFRSVFGASFPSRYLVVPLVARVHDPFRWRIGVGASWGAKKCK
jgi:hypothetical protein